MGAEHKYFTGLVLVLAMLVLVGGTDVLRADHSSDSRITMNAQTSALCKLSVPVSNLDLGDITTNSSHFITFKLLCNGPFSYKMSSRNGGLLHRTADAADGFDNFLIYNVSLSVPIDGGASLDSCSSREMGGSGFLCPFNAASGRFATNSLAQIILSTRGDEAALIAGEYEDEITLTIEART